MPFNVNSHVTRLCRYLPFNADFNSLYEEYADPQHVSLSTRAHDYVLDALGRPGLRLVVLTGDAGHGKTHLCAKILEHHTYSPGVARAMLREKCGGEHRLATTASGASLMVIKDLSEFPASSMAPRLVRALDSQDELLVVCANEGRLRSAIADAKKGLQPVLDALEAGLLAGDLNVDPRVLIVNLNLQSVASASQSLGQQLLQRWAVDQRRWTACGTCEARTACPIYENHRQLSDEERGARRRDGIAVLFGARRGSAP